MLAIHVMHACIYLLFSYLFINSIGVVIAVKGFVDESGVFSVSDWTFCNAVTPAPLTTTTTTTTTTTSATTTTFDHHHQLHHTAKSTYLLLVSGIEIGNITTLSTATTATTADDNNNNNNNNNNSNPPVLPPISSSSSELSVQLLIDYVAGRLPSQSATDLDIASKIVR